ncbi:hypothetical protein B7P43_G00728, partial [Cryptotermes secundus]
MCFKLMCITRTTIHKFQDMLSLASVRELPSIDVCDDLWTIFICPTLPYTPLHLLSRTHQRRHRSYRTVRGELSGRTRQDHGLNPVTKSSALQMGGIRCRNRSVVHCGLIVTIFLIQIVGKTSPKAQYPVPGGQIPAYDGQYPNPGVDTAQGGYPGERSDGSRRQEGPVSRISGQDLRSLLQRVDVMLSNQCTKNVAAQWQFETDVNPGTQQAALLAQLEYADYQRAVWGVLNKVSRDQQQDGPIWRQVQFLSVIGPAALPPELLDRYNKLISDMLSVYNGATTCAYNEPFKCGLRIEPELSVVMGRSRDWDELQYSWIEWRRLTGQKMRDLFEQVVELSNQAAQLNHFKNAAEYWLFPYESPTFRYELEGVWDEVRPLYEQLHAYVRRKLRDLYGPDKLSRKAPLPAHILGDMWGQSWSNILDVTIPYPGKNFLDVTTEMVEQGYTPLAMFRLAEEFYLSLNMSLLPPEFWSGSVIEELPDRVVICQPSAWDFCNRRDYRIKMCTQVTMKDFVTVHHEMAHLQYFLEYRQQPKVFRDGANPGFHEAVGEAVALSIATPRHLQDLGLVQGSVDDVPHNINSLFSLALDKLPFLPFSLVMDEWRWDIFEGTITSDEYNCHWWRLREKFSGIKPPVLRSEIDFDPGSKYHIAANIPYIR